MDQILWDLNHNQYKHIMKLTTAKIRKTILNVLTSLQLPNAVVQEYYNKLNGYKYVDGITELSSGCFIRAIPLSNSTTLPLHNGAFICDINITNNGVVIVCKNFNNRYFSLKVEDCVIFQRLTDEEKIILNALDHLSAVDDDSEEDSEDEDIEDEDSEDENSEDDNRATVKKNVRKNNKKR